MASAGQDSEQGRAPAPRKSSEAQPAPDFATRLKSLALMAVVKGPMLLPYRQRLSVVAWLMTWVVSPVAGYKKRIRDNLAYACPDLPEEEVKRLCKEVPANVGRILVEMASGQEFFDQLADIEPEGPGFAAAEEARTEGRPIVFACGHFGSFHAARYCFVQRGYKVGALYRPVDDPMLDQYFREMLESIEGPVFARSRRGLAQMLRYLRQGNCLAILLDQYVNKGAPVTFFGKTAPTSLSGAEMALKYNALLIPVHGIREGKSFRVFVDDAIPHSDPVIMTQAINDSLETQVRQHMEQWLWIHRRWKPERQRKRAAAKIGP